MLNNAAVLGRLGWCSFIGWGRSGGPPSTPSTKYTAISVLPNTKYLPAAKIDRKSGLFHVNRSSAAAMESYAVRSEPQESECTRAPTR